MSELISGKEALIALANGEEVEFKDGMEKWENIKHHMNLDLSMFLTAPEWMKFRLKPRTITINGVELAPCYAVGIDHTKNEVSIQFNNNEDAVKLNNLLLNIYGFRNA